MSKLTKFEFMAHDITGKNYLLWILDAKLIRAYYTNTVLKDVIDTEPLWDTTANKSIRVYHIDIVLKYVTNLELIMIYHTNMVSKDITSTELLQGYNQYEID